MPDALFERDGDFYVPTILTQGPWSPDAQHGGPPSALLSRAIENEPSEDEMLVARVTIELLRPVPLSPLRLTSEVLRPGRRVQLIGAILTSEDTEIARAVGLKIRRTDLDLPFPEHAPGPLPDTGAGRPAEFFDNPGAFATDAMEIRMLEGDFSEPGPGSAWARLRVPLVEGEPTTGLARVAAIADFGNGISNLAGGTAREWLFINPDLEVRLVRPPEGEWIHLSSTTIVDRGGTGLATSDLSDRRGRLGVAAQSLFVAPMA